MTFTDQALSAAHSHCTSNQAEIEASQVAGCFYCLSTYPASQVTEFLDGEGTALCPECPVDSVIGDASGWPVGDPAFLAAMHDYWFERTVSLPEAAARGSFEQAKNWIRCLMGAGSIEKKTDA